MDILAHLIAVRTHPVPEIREVTVPVSGLAAKQEQLSRDYDTCFVHRTFRASRKESSDG